MSPHDFFKRRTSGGKAPLSVNTSGVKAPLSVNTSGGKAPLSVNTSGVKAPLSVNTSGGKVSLSVNSSGLTLMEVLIVVAIIALILLFLLINFKTQIDKGYDAKRKADLTAIRKAFEEYYNDNDCYPPADILNNCGGPELQPYLAKIPCDPSSKQPYLYIPEGNICAGHRTCTQLRVDSDPDIEALGCNPTTGCGWGEGYNYCLSSGVSVTAAGFDPFALPTPTPPPPPGTYACSPGGVCNSYGPPWIWLCPITFADTNCLGMCGIPANRCPV